MIEQRPYYQEGKHAFFHCVPIEDLAERNKLSRLFWEKISVAPKIGVERFLLESDFFPESLITTRSIVPINDVAQISELLHKGVENKFSMGVRTVSEKHILFGNKLPYVMEIDSSEKIDMFINQTIPQWRYEYSHSELNIRHIILMNNLPEIGTINSSPYHFVARISFNESSTSSLDPTQLILEMVTGTNKLRELDSQMEKKHENMHDVVRYQEYYSPTRYFCGANIQIGINYFQKKFSHPSIFQIDKPFSLSPQVSAELKPEKISYIHTIFNFLHTAINDPTIQLLKRMDFLASIGLSEIEIQGYNNDQTDVHYARIYGLRGVKDETHTGLTSFIRNAEK